MASTGGLSSAQLATEIAINIASASQQLIRRFIETLLPDSANVTYQGHTLWQRIGTFENEATWLKHFLCPMTI
jgi:hypothetical protein